MPFLGVFVLMSGLWDLKDIVNSRQNRSKNKLVSENSVTPAHENCSLRVPGGRGRWVLFSYRNWADSHDAADFALGCKTVGSFLKIGLVYDKSSNARSARASLARRAAEARKTKKHTVRFPYRVRSYQRVQKCRRAVKNLVPVRMGSSMTSPHKSL